MLEVQGLNINNIPFEGLELINELLSFEGNPILIHYRDSRANDILSYWVDYDNDGDRWLYAKISKRELFDYLVGGKSLKHIFQTLKCDYVFLIDTDDKRELSKFKMLYAYSIPDKYLPKEKSFYKKGLSDFYKQYLSKFEYLQKLKENSCIFNIESNGLTHSHTVGGKHAAFALNKLCDSMEAYIVVTAINLYKQDSSNLTKIRNHANTVKNRLSPRIAQTADHSFEVWLAMDTVTFHGEGKHDTELRNTIIDGYKKDVLDVDFTSEEDAKIISAKFDKEERKKIFEPLLSVLDNDDFSVSITDYANKIKRPQLKVRTATAFKDIILPKPTLEELEEEISSKYKLITLVVGLKEGQDVTKMRKKQLLDNILFKDENAPSPYDIDVPFTIDGNMVNLKKPIRCILKIDAAGVFELDEPVLELNAHGEDLVNVSNSIKRQFVSLRDYYTANPQINDDKSEELKKYL